MIFFTIFLHNTRRRSDHTKPHVQKIPKQNYRVTGTLLAREGREAAELVVFQGVAVFSFAFPRLCFSIFLVFSGYLPNLF